VTAFAGVHELVPLAGPLTLFSAAQAKSTWKAMVLRDLMTSSVLLCDFRLCLVCNTPALVDRGTFGSR
jgi:hypothetical protein